MFTENPHANPVSGWMDHLADTVEGLDKTNRYYQQGSKLLSALVESPVFGIVSKVLNGYSLREDFNVLNNPASTRLDRAHAILDVSSLAAPFVGAATGIAVGGAVGAGRCGSGCAALGAGLGGIAGWFWGGALGTGLWIGNTLTKLVTPHSLKTAANPFAYSANPITAGGGTVTIDPTTGEFDYQPTKVQREAATDTTMDTFTVTATDVAGRTASQTISVPILPLAADPIVGTWVTTPPGGPFNWPTITISKSGGVYTETTAAPYDMGVCVDEGCAHPTIPAGTVVGTFTQTGTGTSPDGETITYSGTLAAEYIEAWNAAFTTYTNPGQWTYSATILDATVPLTVVLYLDKPYLFETGVAARVQVIAYGPEGPEAYVREDDAVWSGTWVSTAAH